MSKSLNAPKSFQSISTLFPLTVEAGVVIFSRLNAPKSFQSISTPQSTRGRRRP
jgi:hypothetical protein